MIPILFQKDELNFTSNGLGRLVDMVDCEVSEELNGPYEIEFQYPIGGALFDYMIENGGVVYSTHDDAGDFQAFDIDGHTTPIDGLVTFRGKHISYRLNKYVINPFTASSCAAAMAAIKPNSQPANMQFSFWTDKSVNGNFELTHPVSARAILGGAEGSILDVYGKGEYKFNNFNVMLYTNRGIDSGVTIRYGKNLLDLNREYDTSETYTAIAPYWEKDGVTVYVPGLYVLSPNNVQTEDLPWTDQDGNPILGTNGEPIYFRAAKIEPIPMDFTDAFEEAPTPEVLAQKAREYLDRNKPWLPNENIEIDFVALWQTPEYENVAALQRLSLGDKASVYYPEVNLVCEHQKIIKTVYGPLEEKYRRMEFGNLKSGLGETIIDNETNTIVAIVNSVIQSTPALQAAITHATELIRGGLGGHVVIKTNAQSEPEELLIMDTDDVATAVNVWRFNQGGLGHSHSGYNGPYDDVALTMDGRINANMITTGILNAILIKAGVLSDVAGRNFWNMETGEFSLQNYPTKSEAQGYASDAVDSQTQQDVFNKLTNNGQTQGIYLRNGLLYINASYIQGGTMTLGGSNNVNGTWRVLDANGVEVARGDKDGVTSKALTATDYVYINGGTGSYFNIPLVSGANWSNSYFRLSTDSTKPLLFHAHDDVLNHDVDIYMNTNGFHYSQGTYNIDVNTSGICIVWGSSSTRIDQSGVRIYDNATPSGMAPCTLNYNSLVFRDSNFEKIVSIEPYYSSGKHAFIIRDSSGNVFAKLGPSYSSGEAELQLGGTTLTESQLQRLLALI
jgi:phage minor structural protein